MPKKKLNKIHPKTASAQVVPDSNTTTDEIPKWRASRRFSDKFCTPPYPSSLSEFALPKHNPSDIYNSPQRSSKDSNSVTVPPSYVAGSSQLSLSNDKENVKSVTPKIAWSMINQRQRSNPRTASSGSSRQFSQNDDNCDVNATTHYFNPSFTDEEASFSKEDNENLCELDANYLSTQNMNLSEYENTYTENDEYVFHIPLRPYTYADAVSRNNLPQRDNNLSSSQNFRMQTNVEISAEPLIFPDIYPFVRDNTPTWIPEYKRSTIEKNKRTLDDISKFKPKNPSERNFNQWMNLIGPDNHFRNPEYMKQFYEYVGDMKMVFAQEDYRKFQPYQDKLIYRTDHILEFCDFSPSLVTKDIVKLFKEYISSGLLVKWMDRTHCLLIFNCTELAEKALKQKTINGTVRRFGHPDTKEMCEKMFNQLNFLMRPPKPKNTN